MLSASNKGEMFKTKTVLSFYHLRPLGRLILRDAFVVLLLEPHIKARNMSNEHSFGLPDRPTSQRYFRRRKGDPQRA